MSGACGRDSAPEKPVDGTTMAAVTTIETDSTVDTTDSGTIKPKAGEILHLSDAQIHKFLKQSDKPVIVDVWAPWCGPCKRLAPIMDDMARQYKGKATVVKVNLDENKAFANAHNIKSIPTVLFFQNAEVKETIIGLSRQKAYSNVLDKLLPETGSDTI